MDDLWDPVAAALAVGPPHLARPRPPSPVPEDARPYAVRMRDGVRLATDVHLPPGRGPWPALLSRTPYDKAGAECFMPDLARWFTDRGYAVVAQDVRGKVRSGGRLAPFDSEVVDGYDTLEWLSQQKWCRGPVGMIGDSYFGWTQWAAAASAHPALAAITPRVISADGNDFLDRQGVPALEIPALWALETWIDEGLYDLEEGPNWSIRPVSEVVPAAMGGRRSEFLDAVAAGRPPTSARLPVRASVPALHLGGWWDFAQRGQVRTWRAARGQHSAPQYLVMDATDHGWTHLREPGEAYVDPRHGGSAMSAFLDHYLGSLLPFLDHHLTGAGRYDAAPVRWRLARGDWRESSTWPPEDSRPVTWCLRPGGGFRPGALGAGPDPDERRATWVHNPLNPVPSLAHAYHPLIEPVDEAAVAERDDVLVFETDPVSTSLDLAGPAELKLTVGSSASSAHVMAAVSDVAPDGSAFRILDGAIRTSGPWPRSVTIDLGSTGYRVRPQHRLRLCVASSEFPRYVPHPGSEADPWTAVESRPSEQYLFLGGPRGAQLRGRTMVSMKGEA